MRLRRGPVRLLRGWDTAVVPAGWWPEPDTSRHSIILLYQLVLTRPGTAPAGLGFAFGTGCPFPRGAERHGAVKSPIERRGGAHHRERASAAAPASHRHRTLAARSPDTNASIPTAPLFYRGRGSPIDRERGSGRRILPASAQTAPKRAELPQKTLPAQLRGPTPPIFLATVEENANVQPTPPNLIAPN